MAFKVYALQRLHAANFHRAMAVISSRPVIRTGPGAPPGFGLQPLGTARPKPAINFRSLRDIARQAITTTTNNNNFAAARLTSGTYGAGVLLSYCLSSPVQCHNATEALPRCVEQNTPRKKSSFVNACSQNFRTGTGANAAHSERAVEAGRAQPCGAAGGRPEAEPRGG